MMIKTPMILSDLEKLVTDYTSKDIAPKVSISSLVSLITNGKLASSTGISTLIEKTQVFLQRTFKQSEIMRISVLNFHFIFTMGVNFAQKTRMFSKLWT